MTDYSLTALGLTPRWEALFAPHAEEGLSLARVVRVGRGSSLVATRDGVLRATPSSRLRKEAAGPAGMPAVGDWVAVRVPEDIDVPLIEAVLDRSSAITRGDPGKAAGVQVLAANIDIVFIVHPIDDAPNVRRIERELSLAWDSGAVPVVVLTKLDLSDGPDVALDAVEAVAAGTDVVVTSALTGEGVAPLLGYVTGHRTAVLVGPSGAGKSTLINALLGEERLATREVRVSDGRGRHTTVARELVPMAVDGVLIDTPGLRSLALTGSEDGISSTFPEIEKAAESCRFRDCSHNDEPGCAVQAAVKDGTLPAVRLDSYHKLVAEARIAATKADVRLRAEDARKSKVMGRVIKDFHKHDHKHTQRG